MMLLWEIFFWDGLVEEWGNFTGWRSGRQLGTGNSPV